jgi:hypothetical protein
MSTIHFRHSTTATPEQYIAALTDFGPGRSKLFGNSSDEDLKVHSESAEHADVTEGSGGVWERLDYDWSEPDRLVARTTDSNTWGVHPGHTYTFIRRPDGTSESTMSWSARGRPSKGGLSASCSALGQARPGEGVRQLRQGGRGAQRGRHRRTRVGI